MAAGRRSVELADHCGDPFQMLTRRTTIANALHQAGERLEAGALFAEAERRQAELDPGYPRLTSLRGFQYTEWQLAPAERAAWACVLARPVGGGPMYSLAGAGETLSAALAACAEAEGRAGNALAIAQLNSWLLDIGLARLTLAWAALYPALSTGSRADGPAADFVRDRVETALTGLRRASSLHHLPRALLTAALYHGTLGGDPDEA